MLSQRDATYTQEWVIIFWIGPLLIDFWIGASILSFLSFCQNIDYEVLTGFSIQAIQNHKASVFKLLININGESENIQKYIL